MAKNINIPYQLFSKMIDLLDYWDIYEYSAYTQEMYYDVLFALLKKQQNIELRQAYANIINAESDEERHDARMNYLFEKRCKRESNF
jgi:hypothetical protein